MCCFTGEVVEVTSTRIFARGNGAAQYLAYQMRYVATETLAMVLPLPTPVGVGESAVHFIDLSGYPEFFEHAASGFHDVVRDPDELRTLSSSGRLDVHEVGSYEASFVPRIPDFARLDPRFRMPEGVWEKLPQYADWSFAVFKLKDGRNEVHPMAFEFPRRDPTRLFFPTVHVHDGRVRDQADFDHDLYCQPAQPPHRIWTKSARPPRDYVEWQRADDASDKPTPYEERRRIYEAAFEREPALPAREFMEVDRTKGLVDAAAPLFRFSLHFEWPNQDWYA
jgi:hypothetical protein